MLKRFSGKVVILMSIGFSAVLSGCPVDTPPQCVAGQIVCTQASEGGGQVMKICGSKSGDWSNIIACDSYGCNAEGTACKTAPLCSSEEQYCVEAPNNLSVSFACVNGSLLPTVCDGRCNKDDNSCYDVFDKTCEAGKSFCVRNSSKLSMEFSCSGSGAWSSKYCSDGCDESGEHCLSSTSCTPAESKEGEACEAPNALSAVCHEGKCIPTECENTYKLQGDVCLTGAGCISNGKVNCCDFTANQTVVKDNSDVCTYECRDEYLDCDRDSSNCEVDKAKAHMTACETCAEGYGNCDEDWETGCETKLSEFHLAECGVCAQGWGNCDDDWSNGCEVDFSDSNRQNCTMCLPGYCKLGDNCVDMASEANACGDSCLDCSSLSHVSKGNCIDGACYAESCEEGYETNTVRCCKSDPHGTVDKNTTDKCVIVCNKDYTFNGMQCCSSPEGVVIEQDASTSCNFHCAEGYSNVGGACVPNNCTKDEVKCFVNSDGTGSVRKCIGTGWETIKSCSGTSCNATADDCGDCTDGAKRCDNSNNVGQLSVCSKGKWEFEKLCSNGDASCKNSAECGECKTGDKKCHTDGKTGKTSTCSQGKWQTETNCDNGNSCKSDIECGDCINGTTECRNDVTLGLKRTCSNGKWSGESKCTYNYSCNSTSTDCGSCINNEKKCSSNVPQKCEKGGWNSLTCSGVTNGQPACSDGQCDFTCNSGFCPKDSGCVSNKTDMDNCGSCGKKCTTSSVDYSKTVECSSGSCVAKTCLDGYMLSGGKCVFKNCTDGDVRCTNNSSNVGVVEKCSGNKWVTQKTCTNVSCKGSDCGNCKDGAKQCNNGSDKIGVVQTCSGGQWGNDTTCGAVSCKGTACGDCKNGVTSCATKDMHTADVLTYCENGTSKTKNCDPSISNSNAIGQCASATACGGYKCKTDYCPYNNSCATSTSVPAACGASCTDCTIGIPSHSSATCSSSGTCGYACYSGYHRYNNTCEENSVNNCGGHNYQCNTNGGTPECRNGKCVHKSCSNGYKLVTNLTYSGQTVDVCLKTTNYGAPSDFPEIPYYHCSEYDNFTNFDSHIYCGGYYMQCSSLVTNLDNQICYYQY